MNEEIWREKEEACMAQGEHMEAAPVMGDSGEGWECAVDIECIDRSNEWGDEAGEGDDSYEEGHEGPGIVSSTVGAVVDFFKGLFD